MDCHEYYYYDHNTGDNDWLLSLFYHLYYNNSYDNKSSINDKDNNDRNNDKKVGITKVIKYDNDIITIFSLLSLINSFLFTPSKDTSTNYIQALCQPTYQPSSVRFARLASLGPPNSLKGVDCSIAWVGRLI